MENSYRNSWGTPWLWKPTSRFRGFSPEVMFPTKKGVKVDKVERNTWQEHGKRGWQTHVAFLRKVYWTKCSTPWVHMAEWLWQVQEPKQLKLDTHMRCMCGTCAPSFLNSDMSDMSAYGASCVLPTLRTHNCDQENGAQPLRIISILSHRNTTASHVTRFRARVTPTYSVFSQLQRRPCLSSMKVEALFFSPCDTWGEALDGGPVLVAIVKHENEMSDNLMDG